MICKDVISNIVSVNQIVAILRAMMASVLVTCQIFSRIAVIQEFLKAYSSFLFEEF